MHIDQPNAGAMLRNFFAVCPSRLSQNLFLAHAHSVVLYGDQEDVTPLSALRGR